MGEERNMKGATWLDTHSPRAFVDWHLDYLTGQRATALLLLFHFKRMKRCESGEFKIKTGRNSIATHSVP